MQHTSDRLCVDTDDWHVCVALYRAGDVRLVTHLCILYMMIRIRIHNYQNLHEIVIGFEKTIFRFFHSTGTENQNLKYQSKNKPFRYADTYAAQHF